MWIKWRYNDHGHADFKELEIPDDLDGYESVEDWICENGLVPTWSERFMSSRIKWQKLAKPNKETIEKKIRDTELRIKWETQKLAEYKKLLRDLTFAAN
jgi:hypothetical protein